VATDEFLDAVALVTPDTLDRHPPDAWSARQLVRHLTDAQARGYVRRVRLVAEPSGSSITGYDELLIEHVVALFRALRQSALDILERLSDADLLRYGEHSETGRYTIATWLDNYTQHPREHAAQLREALNS
jgi:hypothetical protein